MRGKKSPKSEAIEAFEIGCFEVMPILARPGWWLVTNKITTHSHRTPGTRGEVETQLLVQSALWEQRKLDMDNKTKKKRGHAWRSKTSQEAQAAKAK